MAPTRKVNQHPQATVAEARLSNLVQSTDPLHPCCQRGRQTLQAEEVDALTLKAYLAVEASKLMALHSMLLMKYSGFAAILSSSFQLEFQLEGSAGVQGWEHHLLAL